MSDLMLSCAQMRMRRIYPATQVITWSEQHIAVCDVSRSWIHIAFAFEVLPQTKAFLSAS